MASTSKALDRGPRYLGTALSDNIAETPEGFLICRNAVIGRTGFQKYKAKELDDPENLIEGLSPEDTIELYRDPEEVFSKATLASFEGKPVTLTHPDELLDASTAKEHQVGHIQNVRKGNEALDSGDWPMLADLILTDQEAIDAVQSGERELSCGYAYKLAKTGDRFEQQNIIGNHVAIVRSARAGSEARINDSADELEKEPLAKENSVKTKQSIGDILKHIFGLGMREYAKDAEVTPEDLADAAEEVHKVSARDDDDDRKHGRDDNDDDKRHAKDDKGEEEKKAKDAGEEGEVKKPTAEEEHGSEAADRRKRIHDAVDRILNQAEKDAAEKEESEDADVGELKRLMNQYLGEEEKEPEHMDAKDDAEEKEEQKDAEEEELDDEENEEMDDDDKEESEDAEEEGEDAEVVKEEPVLAKEDLPKSAFDAKSGLMALKALRPVIAKSKDSKVQAAFDTAYRALRKAISKAKDTKDSARGSHADFRRAAASHAQDDAGEGESDAQKYAKKTDEAYAKILKDNRERNLRRVRV